VARREVLPRCQRPHGRRRGSCRPLEKDSGLLENEVAASSWRPSRAPPGAAVLERASFARFSLVSVVALRRYAVRDTNAEGPAAAGKPHQL